MPVDAFDNHLKIPFVEERLCRLPKNTPGFLSFAFCADAPPLLQVPHRPGLRAFPCGKTPRPPGSCSYWHLRRSAKHMALALRPAPRPKRIRAHCLLYACRISRSAVPPPGARLTGRRFPKKVSASLPSISVQGILNRLPPVLAESIPHKGFSCQTTVDFCFEK